ncbi:MAG: sel1 repeat family protein, partial [Ignavibacteriae bacterium]|nr:sel1 repeat family protein [Ignavibacteriota bacterium]
GLCSYVGRWVPQDVERSLEWWGRAANLGSAEARVRVAITKVSGEKRLRDVEYAIPVLRQSAGEGSVLAQVALGYCYETGTGVPLNKGEAARLYRSTAVRGSQDAYRALKRMHDEIRPAEKEFQITEQ